MKTILIALLLVALAGCAPIERRGPCLATDAQCISDFKEKEASAKATRRAREMRAQEIKQAAIQKEEQERKDRATEREIRAQIDADEKAAKEARAAYANESREHEAKQKKACGKDFDQLRVGMTLARFEQCNESLSFVTESFTQGGAIETYRSTFYWINARNGRVVSYTRRTH